MAIDKVTTKWDLDTKDAKKDLKNMNAKFEASGKKAKAATDVADKGFKKLSGTITKVGGLIAGAFAVERLIAFTSQMVKSSADLSEALSDVRKTTGLSQKEVSKFSNSLEELDTRTSKIDLLGIATAGGRLGIAKNELLGFTESVDKAFVALGDELAGSAEEIATDIAKISDVFDITETFGVAEGINKLGSAINFLGANTKAQSGFILDFTKRLAGAREITNISATDVLGLGATLDELGQSVEISGTAVSQVLTKLGSNTAKFADAAGINIKDFTKLVNTDVNEALILFAKGISDANPKTTELTSALKALGLDGARSSAIVGALAKNTDKLRENQDKANKAFKDGTSLTEEFNIKNNNLAANLAKLGKAITDSVIGSGLVNFLTTVTGSLVDTRSKAEELRDEFLKQNEAINAQERELDPLVERYDELKEQGELNGEEQEELRSIIEQISLILPEVTTEFDKYGNAIEISTGKIEAFIEADKAQNEALRESAIIKAKREIEDATKAQERFGKQVVESTTRLQKVNQAVLDGVGNQRSQTASLNGATSSLENATEARDAERESIKNNILLLKSLGVELTDQQKALIKVVEVKKDGKKVDEDENKITEESIRNLQSLNEELKEAKAARTLAALGSTELAAAKSEILRIEAEIALALGKETEAQKKLRKEREDAEKEAEKLEKDRLKSREDFFKELADLEVKAIEDESTRQIAALELQKKRDLEAQKGRLDAGAIELEEFNTFKLDLEKVFTREKEEIVDKSNKKIRDKEEKLSEEAADKAKKEQEELQEFIINAAANTAQGINDLAFDFFQAKQEKELSQLEEDFDKQIELLGDNEGAKAALTEKFEAEKLEIRKKQAVLDKLSAIFSATIEGVVAVIRAGGLLSPLGAATAISVALQIALIAATPTPFKEGGKVKGDEQLIRVNEQGEEFVSTAGATEKYGSELEAMNKGNFDDMIDRNYIMPAIEKYERNKAKKDSAFADNVSAMTQFIGGFDDTGMRHDLGKIDYNQRQTNKLLNKGLDQNDNAYYREKYGR